MTDFLQVESCIASGMWLGIERLFALRTGIILPNARLLSCLMMVGIFCKKIQDYTGHHTYPMGSKGPTGHSSLPVLAEE